MRVRTAGFSLVELMVAVGIVGVLVTLAVPRYQQFMVQARRGEAKSNLSHIATLQEVYKVEHYTYYQGGAMTGINGVGYRDGKGNDGLCNDPLTDIDEGLGNYLGFRPNGCSELRYFYQFNPGGDAVASAASDAREKHIYPDCNGYGCSECGYKFGDALTLPMGGKIKVCRNITQYCPDAKGCGSGTPDCSAITCQADETSHTSPPCCRPICPTLTGCSCDYDGETRTGTWATVTGQSTPSGAVTPADAYTCETLNQEAEFTETWTASSPTCALCNPCRAPNSYKKHRSVPGQKAPDCDTSADRGMAACACTTAETVAGVGRDCCNAAIVCDESHSRSYTGLDHLGNSLDLSNKWDCQGTSERVLHEITYTPPAGSPPGTTCPPDRSFIRHETACGTKAVTCANACTSTIMPEGACEDKSNTIPPRTPPVCTQSRKEYLSCTAPCGASPICSSAVDLTTCTPSGPAPLPVFCDCPPAVCAGGNYDGDTVDDARLECEAPGPSWTFSSDVKPDGAYECKCKKDTSPPCFDHNNVAIPQSVIDACNSALYTSWDATNCVCVGAPGRSYSITLCTSPGAWDYAALGNTIDTIVNIGGDVGAFTNLKGGNGINQTYFHDANNWANILKKIRCGSPGTSPFASEASVQTFNHLIRYHTEKIDNVDNAHYGFRGTDANGRDKCSNPPVTVTWTCN